VAAPSSTKADRRTVTSTRASPMGTATALQTVPAGATASANRDASDASSALARSRLTPSFSRATTLMKCCGVVRYSAYVSRAAIGGATQNSALPLSPAKPSGRMPTIASGRSLMSIVVPTIAGSPPKRRRQSRALMIVTGAALSVSSSAVKVLPASGVTRSARKYSGDTTSPSRCSGSPWPLVATSVDVNDAMLSNDRADACSSTTCGRDQRSRDRPSRGVTCVLKRMTSRFGSVNGRGRSSAP